MDAGEFLDKWDGDKDLGWPERYAEAYAAFKVEEIAGPMADTLAKISVGGCIVDGDGTDAACCAYCAAAVALAAYHKVVGK